MFIILPKVFDSMGFAMPAGIAFFVMVLFAALTSSIALGESVVSTFEDQFHLSRRKSSSLVTVLMLVLGSLSALGYGPLSMVKILGMQFLDLFDFLSNSVMMPIAASATCLFCIYVIGLDKISEEITKNGAKFKRKKTFNFMIKYLCIPFLMVILVSSVLNAFGLISM